MNRFTNRIAYVVPTFNRPEDLEKLLSSLDAQTVKPDQLIVVDASEPDIRDVCDRHPGLPINYVRVQPPSLARQRNAGMEALAEGITIAGYLDDDLVLEPDATENMLRFWEDAGPDIGGAAMNIINNPPLPKLHAWFNRIFLTYDPRRPGRMMPSSFAGGIPFLEKTTEVDYLYGGATVWRRHVVKEFLYDEWYQGHGYNEDLDYSFRVSQKYRLFVVANSKTWHFSRPIAESKFRIFGKMQVVNRIYFVRKMGCFSKPAVVWSLIGIVLVSVLGFFSTGRIAYLRRVLGNLDGVAVLLRGGGSRSIYSVWKD